MKIQKKTQGDAIILCVEGDIDFSTLSELKEKFESALTGAAKKIILNLAKVSYLDSAGLASLVEAMQKSAAVSKSFLIAEPTKKAKELFEVTKLKKLFKIFDTEAEALNHTSA